MADQPDVTRNEPSPKVTPPPPFVPPSAEEIRRLLADAHDAWLTEHGEEVSLVEWLARGRRTRVESEHWIYELQYSREGDGALPGDSRDEVFVDHGSDWTVVAMRGGGEASYSSSGHGTGGSRRSSFSWRLVARPTDLQHLDEFRELGPLYLSSEWIIDTSR